MIIPKIPRWSTIPQNPLHFGLGFDYYTKKRKKRKNYKHGRRAREMVGMPKASDIEAWSKCFPRRQLYDTLG